MPPTNIFVRSGNRPVPSSDPLLLMEVQRALMLHQGGRVQEAVDVYLRVLARDPNQVDCLQYLGVAHAQNGRATEALPLLERALSYRRNDAVLLSNYGFALLGAGRPVDALSNLNRSLALRPGAPEALDNKGTALRALRRFEEALACFDQALSAAPKSFAILGRRAVVLSELHRTAEACSAYEALLLLRPDHVETLTNLANLYTLTGRAADARALLAKAIQLDPGSLELRLRHCVAWLPLVRDSSEGLAEARAAFGRELEAIHADFRSTRHASASDVIGVVQPFYLAYQEQDNLALLQAFGALCRDMMAPIAEPADDVDDTPRPKTDRVRVGIASAHIFSHSVWQAIVRGWIEELDRSRFEVVVFHLGTARDEQTDLAQARASEFVTGPRPLAKWVSAIREAALDVLIYPEIGMDPLTLKLASMRLVPVQAASWGHPETTGLPTIDFYLSAERFEAADSDRHYSERLVRLPNLGCCVSPDSVRDLSAGADVDLESLGVRAGAAVIVCAGTPFKYAPEHDHVLVDIARRVPTAQFLFFRNGAASELTDRLTSRLAVAFETAGLDPSRHLVVVPWMSRSHFLGAMLKAHVFLDTIGFSGFNTVMQAVECGLPVVTRRGKFMRGRLGSAILEHLGMSELVTTDDARTVDLVARLCLDADLRSSTGARMASGRAALYSDPLPIRALETHLWHWSGRPSPPSILA